jgi:hypothetical protein
LKRARELWDQEQRADARTAADARDGDAAAAVAAFERQNDPLVNAPAAKKPRTEASYNHANFTAPVATGSTELVVREAAKPVDFEARDRHASELARTSHWLPSFTPEAAPAKREAPPKRPPSPITGAPLRAKDLVSLDLKRADGKKVSDNANDGADVAYLCHVSGDEITTQNVLLIKPTGCVVLEPVATRLGILESKRCPVTGAAFKAKDVLKLATAISGYSASGGKDLVVKKYRAQGGGA